MTSIGSVTIALIIREVRMEERVAEQFTISAATAASVVITTVGIYLAFIILVRLIGQRSLASMSSFDLGCVIALGAVMGRTVLLEIPTLAIGVVALATFFVTQGLLGLLRQWRGMDRLMNRQPVLLMAGPRLLHDNMRKAHVVEDEIRQALRGAGIRRLTEVQCVIMERNGAVSVLRQDGPVDPWLVADIHGARHQLAGDIAGRGEGGAGDG